MDIVTLGEILIDMFPAEIGRRLADVSAFRPSPGGAPANVAVAARRLGAKTAFIGKVGDDAFGELLIETLQREGVETRAMRIDPDTRTTMAIIAMPNPHQGEFVFYRNPGADMLLRPDELDEDLLRGTAALHIGSISLIAEPSRSATLRAVEMARAGGALISFDVNYRSSLWPQPEQAINTITAMFSQTHLVKVNEDELRLLTGTDDPVAGSQIILAHGPTACMVTQGAKGSFMRVGDEIAFVPAFAVETVDAIGCGDAFMAGVLVCLASPHSPADTPGQAEALWPNRLNWMILRRSLRYGSAVGALTARKQGVIPALPTAAEVDSFLAAHA
jgi:sugar/nucleoside kinase (ribokinase family)